MVVRLTFSLKKYELSYKKLIGRLAIIFPFPFRTTVTGSIILVLGPAR
jgi:hypothetical protein